MNLKPLLGKRVIRELVMFASENIPSLMCYVHDPNVYYGLINSGLLIADQRIEATQLFPALLNDQMFLIWDYGI